MQTKEEKIQVESETETRNCVDVTLRNIELNAVVKKFLSRKKISTPVLREVITILNVTS